MDDPVTTASNFWDLKASGVLKFITDFVSAVAWPTAAAFIVGLFRKEIIERIPKLSELTLPGGVSAKFNEGLAKVEAKVEAEVQAEVQAEAVQIPLPHSPTTTDDRQRPNEVREAPGVRYSVSADETEAESDRVALRANPIGVVMEEWKTLEVLLRQLANEAINERAANRVTPNLIASLRNADLLTREDEFALLELVELRNLAAHSTSKTISPVEAKRFADVAQSFRRKISRKIASQPSWIASGRHSA